MNIYEDKLESIAKFLKNATGTKVSIPQVRLSNKIHDIEEYRFENNKSYIVINPEIFEKYNQKTGQEISLDALLAHSFFHHVQRILQIDYTKIARRLLLEERRSSAFDRKLIGEASRNLVESSAMLFALAYSMRGRNSKSQVIKKLKQKAYLPHPGKLIKGNTLIIAYLKNHKINQALKVLVSQTPAKFRKNLKIRETKLAF